MARLNYVGLPVGDIGAAKVFYETAFGWALTEFGPTYAATITGDTISDCRVTGRKPPGRRCP